MHGHLLRFVVIQFFSDICFVFGGESGPGFVGSPVVLMRGGHLNVVIELDNLDKKKCETYECSAHPPLDILCCSFID